MDYFFGTLVRLIDSPLLLKQLLNPKKSIILIEEKKVQRFYDKSWK